MNGSRLTLMSVTAVLTACAAPAVSSHSDDPRSQLITQEEIEASRAPTAYEVIQKLHANFLTYRGETSLDRSKSQPYPTVYVDGQEYGSVGMLRNLPASQVSTIRLYRAWEATTKFGTGNMGGVIAVTTRQ
jgi:outer membrane cobalamin receptor